MNALPLGPVMLDVAGLRLAAEEREVLAHPLVGAVILFARNYESPSQLKALTAEIRAVRDPQLLIAVDQEGGRVQRFREGFTALPAMAEVGALHGRDAQAGEALARAVGHVLAEELTSHGVDFSFTPVLDLDFGRSSVIGNRSFGGSPQDVTTLAGALIAESAVRGVIMAARGLTGPLEILDHKGGLHQVFDPKLDFTRLWAKASQAPRIMLSNIKTYPCIGTGQTAVAAAIDAHPKLVGKIERIEKIVVTMADVPMIRSQQGEASRDRKSTRLNSSHIPLSRMPSSA